MTFVLCVKAVASLVSCLLLSTNSAVVNIFSTLMFPLKYLTDGSQWIKVKLLDHSDLMWMKLKVMRNESTKRGTTRSFYTAG